MLVAGAATSGQHGRNHTTPSPLQHLLLEGERLKGKYTIARRLQQLMVTLGAAAGSDLAFEVLRCDHQLLEGQEDVVLVQTLVSIRNESSCSDGGDCPRELARFCDSLSVRLASRHMLVPGQGFQLLTHMFRWLAPPRAPAARGSGARAGSGAQRLLGKLGKLGLGRHE